MGSNNGAGGRSVFSNGALGVEGNYLTAPGEGILAAGNQGDDFYYTLTRTSMAATQLAAAAALISSYAPSLTATEVAEILKNRQPISAHRALTAFLALADLISKRPSRPLV